MALGDLITPAVPRQAGLLDLAVGANTGMGLSTGMIENMMKAQQYAQAQRANQEAMKQQQAMQAYQKAGGGEQGVAVAGAISPQTGMALDDRQMAKFSNAVNLHDKMKGNAYGDLDYYNKTYRPAMIKAGIPPSMLPEYDSVEKLNQGLYQNEMKAAQFKQMAKMRGDVWKNMGGGKAINAVTGDIKTAEGYVTHLGPGQGIVQGPAGPKMVTALATEAQKLAASPKGEWSLAEKYIDDLMKKGKSREEATKQYFLDKGAGKIVGKGAKVAGGDFMGGEESGKFKLPLKGGGYEEVDEDTYNAYVKQYGKP